MKKYYLIIIMLFIILAGSFSCGKLCGCVIPPEQPMFRGQLNNAIWEPVLSDTIKNDSVTVWGKRGSDELKVKLAVNPSSTQTGLVVSNFDAAYTVFPRGGNGPLIYKPDNTVSGNKILLDYRQTENLLSGQLSLTLKLATPTGNAAFDTTRIYFTNTAFKVRLRK